MPEQDSEERQPLLTIAIPTYNRVDCLTQTLTTLLPQVPATGVEVVVFDNASPDGTADYIRSLGTKVRYFRQKSNLGPDINMLDCFRKARGTYVWLLCDDDLPYSNTLDILLSAIRDLDRPEFVYLYPIWGDAQLSQYRDTPVESDWQILDANAFLQRISFLFTFASSIVVRRDSIPMELVERQKGTYLIPAAIALYTAGACNRVAVSTAPLLLARGDNSGGYSAATVFTKNLTELMDRCPAEWYDRRLLEEVKRANIDHTVRHIAERWALDGPGIWNIFRYSCRYKPFYQRVLPALVRRAIHQITGQTKVTS